MIRQFFDAIKDDDISFIEQYFREGWPVNVKNELGISALHEAVYEGNQQVIDLLLKIGADFRAEDPFGNLPIHLSCIYGKLEHVKLLLSYGAEIDATTEFRTWTPLMLALNERHLDISKYLISIGASIHYTEPLQGWTPFLVACDQDLTETCLLLIELGVDIHASLKAGDSIGRNALELISYYGDEEVAAALIEAGIDINHQPLGNGLTALHWAVYNGHYGLMELLVSKGARINIRAGGVYKDRSPLHYAVAGGRQDMAQFLLENGADPLAKDIEGRTPLHLATERRFHTRQREAFERIAELLEAYI